jgi:predicted kinase
VLSGASCSGKTTLAPHLVEALRLPLVAKDDLKEKLYDTLGVAADRDGSRRQGMAAMALLYRVADRLLEAGVGAIVEANFWRGFCEPELRPLVERGCAVRVHCSVDRAVLVRRQLDRVRGDSPRHAGHVAHLAVAPLEALLATPTELYGATWPDDTPPDLDTPVLNVDTADGYAPALPDIIRWVEQMTDGK